MVCLRRGCVWDVWRRGDVFDEVGLSSGVCGVCCT